MKIESNVTIPKKYPFKDMKVNDSFVIPADIKRTAVSVAAMRYGKANGQKFTTRKLPDGTIRCWRTE